MKYLHIFTTALVLFASVFMGSSVVFAQYYGNQSGYITPYVMNSTYGNSTCTNLTRGLYKGLSDVTTGGQVSALQSFLIFQKYLSIAAPTGYFGALTYQAVARYQYAHELASNGMADLATRTSIQTVSCGNNYGYNGGYNNYSGTPVLSSLSMSSGAVGTVVTIYGSGFDSSNNTISFGDQKFTSIPSYNGTAIAFTVPQIYNQTYNNNQYCAYPYSNCNNNSGYNNAGTYPVSVTTNRGTSNSLLFTVTSGNNNCYKNNNNYGYNYYNSNCYNNPISVSNVTGPTTLATGAQGVWSLTLYNPNSNYVSVSARWGDENTYNIYGYSSQQSTQSSSVQGQQTVSFTHTYQTSGYYTVIFTATDNTGAQTNVSATVNVSGSTYNQNQPYLSSISPSLARVGTQVILYGSGFTPTGNAVHFGNGGMMNLSSVNGTRIYYTIPSYVSPCDLTSSYGQYCATPLQQVSLGRYPVYVSNTYGQSSTVYFTVTY